MSLASAPLTVIADMRTMMSAGVGIIQAMEIARAWKKMDSGTAKERRDAILSFFSAGFGVVFSFVDVAEMYERQIDRKLLVKHLESAVALLGSFD